MTGSGGPAGVVRDRVLAATLLATLVVRVVFVACFLDNSAFYYPDSQEYWAAAVNLVETGRFGCGAGADCLYRREPGYPLFIALSLLVFGDSLLWFRLVQGALLAASAGLVHRLLLGMTTRWWAGAGVVCYAFYPFYVFFSGFIGIESVLLPLLVGTTYLGVRYLRSGRRSCFYGASILVAVAFNTRVTAIVLVGALAVLAMMAEHGRRAFAATTIAVCLVGLSAVPWGLRNYAVYGVVTLPYTHDAGTGRQVIPRAMSVWADEGVIAAAWRNARNYASPFLTRLDLQNVFNDRRLQAVSAVTVSPLLLATLLLPFVRRTRELAFMYSVLVLWALPYVALFGQTRYRLPTDFLMIVFAAVLLDELASRSSRTLRTGPAAPARAAA